MKTGKFMAVVLTVVILLAGCTWKKPSQPGSPAEKAVQVKEQEELIISGRFQDNAVPSGNEISDSSSEVYIYYQPEAVASIQPVYPAEAKPSPEEKQEEYRIIMRPLSSESEQLLLKTGRTSPEVFFIAVFDNDIFDYTDYYYTNGIILQLFHPAIGSSPMARALPGLSNSINYYGISLVQNMYTPLKLEDLQPRIGDRPFASSLTVGHQRVSLSPIRHQRLQTELVVGVIGPASGGNLAQDLIHTNTPVGWVNQIENDFIVNYSLRFDQGIYHTKNFDIAVSASAQAGTLYDNLTAGFLVRVGRANDLYASLFQTTQQERPFRKRVRYYIGADIRQKLVFYDATMQGGMFNNESPYTLEPGQVKRFVFTGTVLLGLGLGKYSLEAEQVYLGPEFDGGRHHYWFRIKNIIRLN